MPTGSDRDSVIVLGCDTGLATFGLAAVRLLPSREEVVMMGVIRTEASDAKHGVYAYEDDFRRAREIAATLRHERDRLKVRAFTFERTSLPRNARSCNQIGHGMGVLAALAGTLPVQSASPQEVKKRIAQRADASKVQVALLLAVRYGLRLVVPGAKRGRPEALNEGRDLLGHLPPSMHNHAWDALATIVACLDSDVIRALRPRS